MLHAALEVGFFRPHRQPVGDRTENGLRAGLEDFRGRGAADYRSSEEDEVERVGAGRRLPGAELRLLFDGHRFAGQRGLLDVEIARFGQLAVRGDEISCGEPHQIAGNNFASLDFLPLAVAENSGGRRDILAKLLDGFLRAVGLNEIDGHAEGDDDENYGCVGRISECERCGAGNEQDDDQRIQKEQQQLENWSATFFRRRLVRPELLEAVGGLARGKTRGDRRSCGSGRHQIFLDTSIRFSP